MFRPVEETPKKTETGGVRGKVKLKADPSLLADLQTPEPEKSDTSVVGRSGGADKTPDRGGPKPPHTSHNTSGETHSFKELSSHLTWQSKGYVQVWNVSYSFKVTI